MELMSAIKEGKVVVVAGAGISKDSPSDLPSWWEYNSILLQEIGKLGAECIDQPDNILCVDKLMESLPVVSISEFIVNRIVGEAYYPLISLLDGAEPNVNHLLLAQLAQNKSICAIVTTNFDTLLEKAFDQTGVNYKRFDSPADFDRADSNTLFPIYKIHGSADNTDFAIDTVHQKLTGLSLEKKEVLKDLFTHNHILFLGFSGEDFLFGSDYIPIQNNEKGITWIAHPSSKFNERTKEILAERKADIIHSSLPDFYKKCGWSLPIVSVTDLSEPSSFKTKAEHAIRTLLSNPAIGKPACLGMCINLLDAIDDTDNAERIIRLTDESLCEKEIDLLTARNYISLFSALAAYFQHHDELEKAFTYTNKQLQIINMLEDFYKAPHENDYQPPWSKHYFNKSTVLDRAGHLNLQQGHYSDALDFFTNELDCAYQAMSWEHIASALFGIGLTKFHSEKKEDLSSSTFSHPHFIAFIECAKRVAEVGGCVQVQFDINCALVKLYTLFGQKALMEQAYQRAILLQKLCIYNPANAQRIEEIQSFRDACPDNTPWPTDHLPFFESYDKSNIWYPFGQRPVLSCPEGQKAKELYDGNKTEECFDYLANAIENKLQNEQLLEADYLLDTFIGIMLHFSNEAAKGYNTELRIEFIKKAKNYLDTCVNIEIQMRRIDYLAETLGSLAKANYMISNNTDLDYILFLAEFTLCISSDPRECWQSVLAMEIASYIYYKKQRYKSAKYYCEWYLCTVGKYPDVAAPENVIYMKDLYTKILKESE